MNLNENFCTINTKLPYFIEQKIKGSLLGNITTICIQNIKLCLNFVIRDSLDDCVKIFINYSHGSHDLNHSSNHTPVSEKEFNFDLVLINRTNRNLNDYAIITHDQIN